MKYETPELLALTPAINVIQTRSAGSVKNLDPGTDSLGIHNEGFAAYEDWE